MSRKRKSLFGDFNVEDLRTPTKRKRYWNVSQATVRDFKIKTKSLQNKNAWLRKKIKNLSQLINHLKEEKKISDNCFTILKVEIAN